MLLALILACEGGLFGPSAEELLAEDNDADGFSENDGDCNDANPDVFPDNDELCDSLDNDCDLLVDETVAGAFYLDADDDGYGGDAFVLTCTQPAGYVPTPGDCEDENPFINPEGVEDGCDLYDDDCDGLVDEGFATAWFVDADGDGYGDPDTREMACEQPSQVFVDNDFDCDDDDPDVNPVAADICNGRDDDCDGQLDEDPDGLVYQDADGDGWGTSDITQDGCGSSEGWSDVDGDCDDGDPNLNPETVWYVDVDRDGHGSANATTQACQQPEGYASAEDDCDDGRNDIYPGATEACDEADQDCDDLVDEGSFLTFYLDQDNDGYGSATSTQACSAPTNYVADSTDCDDTDGDVNPGAAEVCDSADQDCDSSVDEGALLTFYDDGDGDTYGDPNDSTQACSAPSGYVEDNTDCDDALPGVNPGATETCDGVDEDCDSSTDEGLSSTYYLDSDGDGYGLTNSTTTACALPSGYSATDGDCNDGNSAIHPAATESCNSADDDCDSSTDEGVTTTFYRDADGDSYGTSSTTTEDCTAPSGYDADDGDCDDTDGNINPDAAEICGDGVDNDCDGTANSCSVNGTFDLETDYDLSWYDSSASSYGGWSMANAGDVDGDGADDLLMGAKNWSSGKGRAYLAYGGLTSGDHAMTGAEYLFAYSTSGGQLGYSVAGGGDFDGDGVDDFLLGEPYAYTTTSRGGAVFVVLGPGTSMNMDDADAWLQGSSGNAYLGTAVRFVDDVDGDGTDELVGGSPYHTDSKSYQGMVGLLYGGVTGGHSADVTWLGAEVNDYLGDTGLGTGDMNGDGHADLAIGAWGDDSLANQGGSTYLSFGPLTDSITVGSSSDLWIRGAWPNGRLGTSVVLHDVDDDGYDDLLTGAVFDDSYNNNSGAAYLFLGPASGITRDTKADVTFGSTGNHYLGQDILVLEDMDDDGEKEVAVSGWYGAYEEGRVMLWNGPFTGAAYDDGDAFALMEGQYSDHVGWSLASLDWDGDGSPDLAVGAPREDTGGTDSGMVYLLLGGGL